MAVKRGIFIVFKFLAGELDTTSYSTSWNRKPPARTYDTEGKAKAQWQRYIKDGYEPRAAEITFEMDPGGELRVYVRFIDQDWVPKGELCKHRQRIDTEKSFYYQECKLRKNHDGLHSIRAK